MTSTIRSPGRTPPAAASCARLTMLSAVMTWPTSDIDGHQTLPKSIRSSRPGSARPSRWCSGRPPSRGRRPSGSRGRASRSRGAGCRRSSCPRSRRRRPAQRAVGDLVGGDEPEPSGPATDDAGRGAVGDQVVGLLVDRRRAGTGRRSRTGPAPVRLGREQRGGHPHRAEHRGARLLSEPEHDRAARPKSACRRLAGKSIRCFTSPVRSHSAGSPALPLPGRQVAYTIASISASWSARPAARSPPPPGRRRWW